MAIVRNLYRKQTIELDELINTNNLYHKKMNEYIKFKEELMQKKNTFIQDTVNLISEQSEILITHTIDGDDYPSSLILLNEDSKQIFLEKQSKIFEYKKSIKDYLIKIDDLRNEHQITIQKIKKIKENINRIIWNQSIIKEVTCNICFDSCILVDLKISCNSPDNISGKPLCHTTICYLCAKNITINNNSYPKCYICKSDSRVQFKNFQDAYKLNIHVMKMIDIIIENESNEFYRLFKCNLNPIKCNNCNLPFNSFISLYNHLYKNLCIPMIQQEKSFNDDLISVEDDLYYDSS